MDYAYAGNSLTRAFEQARRSGQPVVAIIHSACSTDPQYTYEPYLVFPTGRARVLRGADAPRLAKLQRGKRGANGRIG